MLVNIISFIYIISVFILFYGYLHSSEEEIKKTGLTKRQILAIIVFWPIILLKDIITGLFEVLRK